MIKYYVQIFRSLSTVLLCMLLLASSGCSFFYKPIEQAQHYALQQQYDAAVDELSNLIDSDAPEKKKAHAFMLRGKAYTSLKEYRYAYRDLQVAWKLSCHIYQISPAQQPTATDMQKPQTAENATQQSTPTPFSPALACIEQLPRLIDDLKPFTSEFGAIMATQEASAIVKKLFPEMPR